MQIRPIRTDKDHRAALAEIEKLWVASIGTPDAARRAAEDAFLDRTDLTVSPKAYAESLARLDAPPTIADPTALKLIWLNRVSNAVTWDEGGSFRLEP